MELERCFYLILLFFKGVNRMWWKNMYSVFRPGHQFQLSWSLVYRTLGKIQYKFFLRLSFHLHVIVIRTQRDKLGNGLVPMRAQQLWGPLSPMCTFLIFFTDFMGAAFINSNIFLTMAMLPWSHSVRVMEWVHVEEERGEKSMKGIRLDFKQKSAMPFLVLCYMLLSLQDLIAVIAERNWVSQECARM